MTKVNTLLILSFIFSLQLSAQKDFQPPDKHTVLPVDTVITLDKSVKVNGEDIPYTIECGTQPVYDKNGIVVASLFYTFYRRNDVKDISKRPLMLSFNGGPGAGSLWMHLGYTSPVLLQVDDEGYPIQPYGIRENPHSIIDVADIVYINPVNTGFSRIVGGAEREQFFGVKQDVSYLADWIDVFVSRQNRWTSPKYLIGESYGTTRVSGLAGELQGSHWMFLNGVILVSPTDLGQKPDGPMARSNMLKLPYYTAAAWYHQKLSSDLQQRELEEILPEAEEFTLNTYGPALARGGSLTTEEKSKLAEQIARWSGLSSSFVLQNNLSVSASAYWKELLRDEGYTIGRLDSRYRGIDKMEAGTRYDYPAELTSWNHAFAPAINHYLREHIGIQTDMQYKLFGSVYPWDRSGDNTGERLRKAMAENPYLHVMIQSGYFDGATDYFSAKYVMWQLDPSGKMRNRLSFKGYRSGHMMYLRRQDLKASNNDIRDFLKATMTNGKAAKY